jgi:tetratricopeptide (TPR) repeat protein
LLERALAIFDPGRDSDLAFRFAQDLGVSITAYLALVLWPLGEVDRAREVAGEMVARATKIGHVGTAVYGHFHFAMFEMMHRNPVGAAPHIEALIDLAGTHAMPTWTAYGGFLGPWSRRHLDGPHGGLAEMRAGIAACREQGIGNFIPFIATALAETEVEAGEIEAALATIDGAIADGERTGQCWFDAESRRTRGDILLKRDPTNTAPAEEAFLTAIAIAQQQKARSFELRAALSLAKLYHSTGRHVDAHAVLAPALEGFSPTPEFSEIAEAQALLAALERDEAVKAESERRGRRVQLQLAYGAALMSARGYGAEETVKAFDRARELSAGVGGSVDRLALLYGTWLGAVTTESFDASSKASAALLAEATQARNTATIAVAHRAIGATLLYGGLFDEAKRQCDQATSLLGSTDDADLARRFNGSPRAAAQILRAFAAWATSDFNLAARDAQEAAARAERADAMTRGYVLGWAAILGAVRRDVPLTSLNASRLLNLVADTGLRTWAPVAEQFERWSRSMSGDESFSTGQLRAARPALQAVGHDKIVTPVIGVLAAETDVRNGRADEALALIEELITDIRATGLRWAGSRAASCQRRGTPSRRFCRSGSRWPRSGGSCRRRARTGRARVRIARGTPPSKALSVNQPCGRSPRHPNARARRLLADAAISGDSGSASAARCTGERRSGQGGARESTARLTMDFETASQSGRSDGPPLGGSRSTSKPHPCTSGGPRTALLNYTLPEVIPAILPIALGTCGRRGLMLYPHPYTDVARALWRMGHKPEEKTAYPQARHSGVEQAL